MAWILILLSGRLLGLAFPERQESSAVLKSEFIVTYTWKRKRIKRVVLDSGRLRPEKERGRR